MPLDRAARALHAAVGVLAGTRASAPLVPWLVRRYRIDLSDAAIPPSGFPTVNALFTRTLAPGARPGGLQSMPTRKPACMPCSRRP